MANNKSEKSFLKVKQQEQEDDFYDRERKPERIFLKLCDEEKFFLSKRGG